MKPTLIFDLDGTLLDSTGMHDKSFEWACCQQYSDFKLTPELIAILHSKTTTKKGQLLNSEYGYNFDLEKLSVDKQSHTDIHMHHLSWHPGIPALFNTLYKKYNVVIASNARSHFVYEAVQRMGLTKVDLILTSQCLTLDEHKPNPAIFIKAMQYVGADPETTTIIEDSTIGIQAAQASGAKHLIKVANSNECYDFMETLI